MPLPDPIIEVLTVCATIVYGSDMEKTDEVVNRNPVGAVLPRLLRQHCVPAPTPRQPTGVSFHQVLNRARWSPLAVCRQLLVLIVETFVPAGASVDLVIDETLERRWGSKISKRGHYLDSALSRRSVSSPDLRWIVMAVVVTLPWTKQRWALPFLCVLTTTPEVCERLGKRHKTVGHVGASDDQSGSPMAS